MFEDVVEHRFKRLMQAMAQNAVGLRLFLGLFNEIGQFGRLRVMLLFATLANADQMLLQPTDRITQRPFSNTCFCAITAMS